MIKEVQVKQILSTMAKPDSWFGLRYNMNLYRGCQHQCIYCDSRSQCYQIENFSDVLVKVNAISLLEEELKRKKVIGTIGFGAMSDPYTLIESKYKLTRSALETILKHKFPIHIITKSSMIVRDKDIIQEINKIYSAISFTITTTDDELARKIEPFAPAPSARLKAIKILSDAGIYCGVTLMPILPFLEDNRENIRNIIEKASDAGAKYIIPGLSVTLRDRQRAYYYKKLDELFPGLRQKYIKTYGAKYGCVPDNIKELYEEFHTQCEKYRIAKRIKIFEPIEKSKLDIIEMF